MPKIRRTQKPPASITNYRQFKKYLRLDFHRRCAYCHQPEGPLHNFGVEHFRPKSRFPKFSLRYSNLLYACNECNCLKGEAWPSLAERREGRRFLNPCVDDFTHHFHVSAESGELIAQSRAGEYMVASIGLNRQYLVLWRSQKARLTALIAELNRTIEELESGGIRTKVTDGIEDAVQFLQKDLDAYGDWWV